jgi:hypothetical protein
VHVHAHVRLVITGVGGSAFQTEHGDFYDDAAA